MLHPIYKAIKQHLTAADVDGKLKGIEKYNLQYQGTITNTPRVFVEFPEKLEVNRLTKSERQLPLPIRLHVVSKAMARTDGVIADEVVEAHEALAVWVKDQLDGFQAEADGVKLSTIMHWSGWQDFPKYKEWLVIHIYFDSKKKF